MALQQTHHQHATQPSSTDSHYHSKPTFNKFHQQIGLLYPNVTDTWRKGVYSEATFSFPSQPGNQYHYWKLPDNTTSYTTCFGTQINFVTLIDTFPYLFHPSDPSQEPGNLLCTSLAHKNEHPGIRVYPGATAIPALHLKALLSNNCVLVLVMSFHGAERGTWI